jgi:nitrogen fixation protein NifU and related proteins
MQLSQMYQEIILDHYRNPHGAGLREPFDAESFQINPTCGDEVTLRVALKQDGPADHAEVGSDSAMVADVSYDALGCSISQAAASVLTDLVVGRSVADALRTMDAFQEMVQGRGEVQPDEDVLGDGVAFAGVAKYPARVKCALLGWMAFKDAVARATDRGGDGSPADAGVSTRTGAGDTAAGTPEGNGAKA